MSSPDSRLALAALAWPSPAHLALAQAIDQDDPAAAEQALAQGVKATDRLPEPIDDTEPEGLVRWAGLGYLAVAVLANKPLVAQVLTKAGATWDQPDDEGAPLALTPFMRQQPDWVQQLSSQGVHWNASHPQGAHGYGPLAHALAGHEMNREAVLDQVLTRPGSWDDASRTAVFQTVVQTGSWADLARLSAVGLQWSDTSPATREAVLGAALLSHQGRRPTAVAWLDFLARERVPLSSAFTYLHPATRADYAQRLVANNPSAMAIPPVALDPLASPASAPLPTALPAAEVVSDFSGHGASVMGAPPARRRMSP